MKKSEWSDKQLEELLRQMPKIKDDRNPRDIYQNISLKNRRKSPVWLLPVAATAAALFLIILLVPKLMIGTDFSLDKNHEEKFSNVQENSIANDNASVLMKKQEASQDKLEIAGTDPKKSMQGEGKTALYDYEVGNGKVVTYWIPDQMGQILVPITTIVSADENQHWLQFFNQTMDKLVEEEWGLTDYYPLNATISIDSKDNSIVVDVPANHTYGQGSANENLFLDVLYNTITSNGNENKIWLKTNGQPGIDFGNHGKLDEIDTSKKRNYTYFLYYPEGRVVPYIVPSSNLNHDIYAAVEAMKTDQPNFGLKASLGPAFPYKQVTVEDNKLMVTMSENAKMINDLPTLYSFEALLLTAKAFGIESITIVNPPITQLGPFDLTQETMVPIGANFQPIE